MYFSSLEQNKHFSVAIEIECFLFSFLSLGIFWIPLKYEMSFNHGAITIKKFVMLREVVAISCELQILL